MVLGFFAVAVGPVTYLALPPEIARWYLALAAQRARNDDLPGALAAAEQAAKWNPEEPAVPLARGRILLDTEQYEDALAAAEEAVKLAPESIEAIQFRSLVRQYLGDFASAAEDSRRAYKLQLAEGETTPPRGALSDLNGWAYARGLAGEDLEAALADINMVIERMGPEAAFLDTRGYIEYRLGDSAKALPDLDRAVRDTETEYHTLRRQLKRSEAVWIDLTPLKEFEKAYSRNVAVIRYHRGLAHEALGNTEAHEADMRRVRELGFEPGEHLF